MPTEAAPNLIDPRYESLPPPPPPKQDNSSRLDGVIVLVSAGDVYLAKACCASIRQSMGNIPITLLTDGPGVDTSALEKLPNVKRMVAQEVAPADCKRLVTGIWVKILVLWMSPYDRYLYLDADTLVWGDMREYAEFDKYDFIAGYRFNTPFLLQSPQEVSQRAFDIDIVQKMDPTLEWRGQEFANAGVYFARNGIFSRDELLKFREIDCWRACDNGLQNYLRWRAAAKGTPRVGGHKVQLFPANPTVSPEDRFLPRDCRRPVIIHWITKKPKLGRRYRAVDDYRKLFLKMVGKTTWLNTRLFLEDLGVWLGRHQRSLLGQTKRSELK
jgi:hypothetical protein